MKCSISFLNCPFRKRCQELRSELFYTHQKTVCEERKAQIAFNEELKRQKVVEEQMFSKLWEEDRLAKERRVAEEERLQKELVENTRLGLNAQVASIQAQRQAARRLKEEEARLVVGVFKGLWWDGELTGYNTRLAGLLKKKRRILFKSNQGL